MHDQIVAPLQRAKDQGATVEPIQFGLEVASRPAKNPVGYEYVGRPIVKPEGVDPLAAMEEKFDGLRQLPAPAKEAAKK